MADQLPFDPDSTATLADAARRLVALHGSTGPARAEAAAQASELRRQRAEEAATFASAVLLPKAMQALQELLAGQHGKDVASGIHSAARTTLELAQLLGPKAADQHRPRATDAMSAAELEAEIVRTRRMLAAKKAGERVVADLMPTGEGVEL
jgi:hypothetical protein